MNPIFSTKDSLELPPPKNIFERIIDWLLKYTVVSRKTSRYQEINRQLKARETTPYGIFRFLCKLLREEGGYDNDLFIYEDIFREAFLSSKDGLDIFHFVAEIEGKYGVSIPDDDYERISAMTLLEVSHYIFEALPIDK